MSTPHPSQQVPDHDPAVPEIVEVHEETSAPQPVVVEQGGGMLRWLVLGGLVVVIAAVSIWGISALSDRFGPSGSSAATQEATGSNEQPADAPADAPVAGGDLQADEDGRVVAEVCNATQILDAPGGQSVGVALTVGDGVMGELDGDWVKLGDEAYVLAEDLCQR